MKKGLFALQYTDWNTKSKAETHSTCTICCSRLVSCHRTRAVGRLKQNKSAKSSGEGCKLELNAHLTIVHRIKRLDALPNPRSQTDKRYDEQISFVWIIYVYACLSLGHIHVLQFQRRSVELDKYWQKFYDKMRWVYVTVQRSSVRNFPRFTHTFPCESAILCELLL